MNVKHNYFIYNIFSRRVLAFKLLCCLSLFPLFFAIGCNHNGKDFSQTEEISITVKGDEHVTVKDVATFKKAKGVTWKDIKDTAKAQIKEIEEGWKISCWKLNDANGNELKDDYKFDSNATVFAVSKKQIVLTIEIDSGYTFKDSLQTSSSIEIESGDTWGEAKAKAKEKVVIKDGYSDAGWRLGEYGAYLEDSFVFSSNSIVYATSRKQTDPEVQKITITVSCDNNLTAVNPNTFLTARGAKWKALKNTAIKKIILKDNFDISEWHLNDMTGELLNDDSEFQNDAKVFAVSRSKNEILVRVKADERLDVKTPAYISISSEKTFGDVKAQIEAKLSLKKEWPGIDYGIYDFRHENEDGDALLDSFSIKKDITVFVRTNYKRFKLEDTKLTGYEGSKPRGRIIIPKDITSIEEKAFYNSRGLTAVNLNECSKLTKIVYAAFHKCTGLEKINFNGCTALVELGEGVFTDCSSLTSVDLSPCVNLTEISKLLFTRCSKLESINLSGLSKITKIGEHAFSACTSLKEIDLSPLIALVKIEDSAFFQCEKLENVNLTGLSSIEEIGTGVFADCTSLKSIDLSPCTKLTEFKSMLFLRCNNLSNINFSGLSNVIKIGSYVFKGCKSLESIDLSKLTGLLMIEDEAFSQCEKLTSVSLTGLSYINHIGDSIFSECTSLTSIDLSPCVRLTGLGKGLFSKCSKLENVNLSGLSKVSEIGANAFWLCTNLKSIDLSPCKELTTIANSAFYQCDKLENINLTDLNNIRDIGDGAFCECSSLTSIDFSSSNKLIKLGNITFWKCTKLESVKLNNTSHIEEIGENVFRDCPALANLDLSLLKSITTIKKFAFFNCTGLTLKLPQSITTLGERPFGTKEENCCKRVLVPSEDIKTLVKSKGYPESKIDTYIP